MKDTKGIKKKFGELAKKDAELTPNRIHQMIADEVGKSKEHVYLKVVSEEMLKDLPKKWDLADPLPSDKSNKFVSDCLLRAESKAIGLDRLNGLASEYGMSLKQLNDIVCNADERLRSGLEKQHGSKTWEIETAILAEASSIIQESSTKNFVREEQKLNVKQQSKGERTIEKD